LLALFAIDLAVRVRGGGGVSVARWALKRLGPAGRLVTASRFAGVVSTAAIKTADKAWRRPPSLSLSQLSCHSALTLLVCYCTLPSAILAVLRR
jgi:hypothetical protein